MQPAVRPRASWLHAPQRLRLRRAAFQVHLWLGILLAAYSVVIGLSGALLVFHEEIEDAYYANQLHITPQPRQTSFDAILASVRALHPDGVPVGMRDIGQQDHALEVVLRSRKDPTTTNLRYVAVDPNTGRILLDRLRYDGPLGWAYHLHFYLLLNHIGLTISGWMALGLLLLCLSGIVLWWPGLARWASALTLHRRSSVRRFLWELHSVTGFWAGIALAAVAFTGVYFAFPLPIAGAIVKLTGDNLREASAFVLAPPAKPSKPGAPVLSVDRAIAILNEQMAPAPPLQYLQLPTTPRDTYSGISDYPTLAPYTDDRRVSVDPHSGAVLRITNTHDAPVAVRIVQYFHAIHFGTFAGTRGLIGYAVRALWVLLGITPALLAVTGLLMYWNRKLRPLRKRLS
jgi:uncharacterized iron-regulated membrane protein